MKNAMILAAGRGERLRPLTDLTPKPMLPVDNVPVIEQHVQRLAKAGFNRIVINHAWLGSQIRRHLKNGAAWSVQIEYSPEPPGGLETGGGLYQALSLLGDEPFLAINADIVTDYPFRPVTLSAGILAHLVLVPTSQNNPKGNFSLQTNGLIDNNPLHVYSGIAAYHPAFFKSCIPGRYSVVPALRMHSEANRITGEIYQGLWRDIGVVTPL